MDILILRGAWMFDDGRIRNSLLRNNGDGTFSDVADQLGVSEPGNRSFVPWFFDNNSDGWLDLFVAAYDATVEDVVSDFLGLSHQATSPCLYRNQGNGTFTNVAPEVGLNQDIYHQLGGHLPGDKYQNALFLNPGHGNHFLVIKLVGTRSNRSAVGATPLPLIRGCVWSLCRRL